MASVPLDFTPPSDPNIVSLKIWEANNPADDFALIEQVPAGTYPNYITRYTTDQALDVNDWFSITWVDDKGAETTLSPPVQGGTTTLVNTLVTRVHERDASLDEIIVTQEAEGVIQYVFGTNVDPYNPALTANYRQLNGMTYLVMARAYTVQAVTTAGGSIESATMGLVTFKNASGSTSRIDASALIDLANKELGIGTSFVMQLQDICLQPYIVADFSRLTSGWLSIDT